MAAQKTLLTAEQFYREYSGKEGRYELVRGEVVTMTPPGGTHGRTAAKIVIALGNFLARSPLGELVVETGFLVERRPDTIRGPDVAFVRKERVPSEGVPEAFFQFAPDLAVEVVSPSDTAAEVEARVYKYLEAGSRQVWVFYPNTRRVAVHHPGGTARWYGEQDTLDGGDLLPGFSVPVREFFA